MYIALQLRLCGKNINFVVALLLATPTELGIYASSGENIQRNHKNKGELSLLFVIFDRTRNY
jgi:hypothetical protein